MVLPRRTFLQLAAGAAVLPTVADLAWARTGARTWARTYPAQPVRIVVGLAPGSAADIVSRLLGQALSERLGREFIVDNQPGVGGNVAAEMVVKAAPDGHTLLMTGPSSAINASLYQKLDFNFRRDIAPVAAVAHFPNVMLVNPTIPARTVAEFIALAQASPGHFKLASAGVGTGTHLAGELFEIMTGVNLVHVPYRGGDGAFADLLSGTIDVYFPTLATSLDHIRSGAVCALAVTTVQRQALLDVPTVGEFVPGYEAGTWFGIGAPRGTPTAIVAGLNREINASLADPAVKARIAALGGTTFAGSPADFGRLVAEETEKCAKVIRSANVA